MPMSMMDSITSKKGPITKNHGETFGDIVPITLCLVVTENGG